MRLEGGKREAREEDRDREEVDRDGNGTDID